MKNMIDQAKERIYISCSGLEFDALREELANACKRELKVVAISSDAEELEGMTLYRIDKKPGSVRLIVDSSQVLTGELAMTDEDTCL
jgi:hypothetical protein